MTISIYNTNFIVYKYTSKTSGKSYIGYTSNEKERKYRHKYDAYNNSNTTFHRAIRKYGWNDFKYSIIYYSISSDYLNDSEIELIETYNTYNNGYNMTIGGISLSGYKPSEETTDNRSTEVHQYTLEGEYITSYKSGCLAKRITGCHHISQAVRFGSQAGGYLWSTKRKNKINPYNKNISIPVPVYQYDLDGNYIIGYESIKSAANVIKGNSGNIYTACINNWRSSGYMWGFEKYDSIPPYKKTISGYKPKSVNQYNLDGNFLQWFESSLIASRETSTCKQSIYNVCNGNRKTAGGYIWRYDK